MLENFMELKVHSRQFTIIKNLSSFVLRSINWSQLYVSFLISQNYDYMSFVHVIHHVKLLSFYFRIIDTHKFFCKSVDTVKHIFWFVLELLFNDIPILDHATYLLEPLELIF